VSGFVDDLVDLVSFVSFMLQISNFIFVMKHIYGE